MRVRTTLALVGALLLQAVSAWAADAPLALEDARRLSLEDPRAYIEQSPRWLEDPYAQAHPEWTREILLRRGRAAWMLSDRAVARSAMEALDTLARTARMPIAEAYAHLLRADENADLGQYESAIAEANAAAAILRATKEPFFKALAQLELCDAYWSTEQGEKALPNCRRAEKYFRAQGDDWHLARTENIIAMLLEDAGQPQQSLALAESARARFVKLGLPSMVAMIDDNMSSLALNAGDPERALALSQRSLALELASGKLNHAVSSYVNIALAQSALGRHQQALANVDHAIKTAAQIDLLSRNDVLYLAQWQIAEAAGKLPLALQAARHALEATKALSTEQRERAIAEMDARFAASEQRREIERLAQDQRIRELELARSQEVNARQSAQLARQRLWLWLVTGSVAALLLMTGLLFALWRASRRNALRMRVLAETDALTQVYNRRAFLARLEAEHARVRASGGRSCIAVIDADHFKSINDLRGHQVGDRALQRLAAALRAGLGPADAVGRMGGEEFALLWSDCDLACAQTRAEALRARVADDHLGPEGLGFPMSISVGVAELDPAQMGTVEDWLVAGDRALYRAKDGGRNRIVVHAAGAALADVASE